MSTDDSGKDQIIINQRLEIDRLKGQVKHYKEVNRSLENELSDTKVQRNYYQKLNGSKLNE